MRPFTDPNDASLNQDGTAKVNRKHVGVWWNQFSEQDARNMYFFALGKGEAPVARAYYRHEFRAEISRYLFKNGLLTLGKNGRYERTAELSARNALLEVVKPSAAVSGMSSYELESRARKARGASYGHVKRRIHAGERLRGKTLKLALELVTPASPGEPSDELYKSIAIKLNAGEPLDDYQRHIMCDVVLLHARLSPLA